MVPPLERLLITRINFSMQRKRGLKNCQHVLKSSGSATITMADVCGARKERFLGMQSRTKVIFMFFHEEKEKRHPVSGLMGPNGSIETSDDEKRNRLQKATTKMLNKKVYRLPVAKLTIAPLSYYAHFHS